MPARYLEYYTKVADRLLPFLLGRRIAIEQRFPGSETLVFRRHSGGPEADTWIQIEDRPTLLDWARQYAEGLHAHIRSVDRGAWFVIDIDSRNRPLTMARLATLHAVDVLAQEGIEPLVKFSGSDGFHLMWDVPDLGKIGGGELWDLERSVVRAVACQVERRLHEDPAAASMYTAVGDGHPAITTANADRDNPEAILFDEYILKDNANFRVPFSVHPRTGLVTVPLTTSQLRDFQPEDASPDSVANEWPALSLPTHTLADVRKALSAWRKDGC